MASVCFVIDTIITGALLPRHLNSIRKSYADDYLLPILVTSNRNDARLASIERRYKARCLVMHASLPLGARLNKAVLASQAEWLIIALQNQPLPADLWSAVYSQLDNSTLDALIIGIAPPTFPERILQRLLASALLLPPYIAVRRVWFERLGGFDPELESNSAIKDFVQRLHACPTRLKTFSGNLFSQAKENNAPSLPNRLKPAYTPWR